LCGQNAGLLNVKLAVQTSKQQKHEIWFVKIVNAASSLKNRAVLYLLVVYLTTPSTFQIKYDWKGAGRGPPCSTIPAVNKTTQNHRENSWPHDRDLNPKLLNTKISHPPDGYVLSVASLKACPHRTACNRSLTSNLELRPRICGAVPPHPTSLRSGAWLVQGHCASINTSNTDRQTDRQTYTQTHAFKMIAATNITVVWQDASPTVCRSLKIVSHYKKDSRNVAIYS